MAEVGDFYHLKRPLNYFRTHPGTNRNHFGESIQLIETIDIISRHKQKINRTILEQINLKIHLGSIWFYYAKSDFSSFRKTFVTVLTNTFRHEPLLLFFLLFSIPAIEYLHMNQRRRLLS